MDDINDLAERLHAALARIEAVARAADPGDANMAEFNKLRAENETLQKNLEAFRQQRDSDVAQLDTLISQLKPLVEEVS